MTQIDDFKDAGFSVIRSQTSDDKKSASLLDFLKRNYPGVIRDGELKLDELKNALGLPVDEKVNGYGLNFIGRNVARAKYAQKTEKELCLNESLSKDIEKTRNLVLKGDNLDSLKILKSHYSGKIKCIYIDPPYNTAGEDFVYPDKFDKEEAEVLGLANLSESDMERMEFSFRSKRSHNGWLSFIYPRLLLARDLMREDGVMFISIDDNEQANLKLLCDEVFGEENFVGTIPWRKRTAKSDVPFGVSQDYEWILCFAKPGFVASIEKDVRKYYETEDFPGRPWRVHDLTKQTTAAERPNSFFTIIDPKSDKQYPPDSNRTWAITEDTFKDYYEKDRIVFPGDYDFLNITKPVLRYWKEDDVKKAGENFGRVVVSTKLPDKIGMSQDGTKEITGLLGDKSFPFPKPLDLIKYLIRISIPSNDDEGIILDFFAGSGTTGQAVMQLNAEDGGKRRFILCQIDEPIKEDWPAFKFCMDNNLPPLISSITIERLRRAGKIIADKVEADNKKKAETIPFGDKSVSQISVDTGFKVFDSADAPKLVMIGDQIRIKTDNLEPISRIYNMLFTVGLDDPTQAPETVVQGCIYRMGGNYYLTNCDKISQDDLASAIKNGKVFIDGWTASLNGTLQSYKDDVKIVF